MSTLRDSIEAYVKRVQELADHCRGNEQATKQSLIGPFFTMLGYDLTDPRECVPEHKADFGKERSTKPIDWGFKSNGSFIFFVEAKEVGKKLAGYDEQLADYFAKDTNVRLGILTNGAQWRFYTDVINPNVMDKEPFATWDVLSGETPPFDVLTLLEKANFNAEMIRAYAQRERNKNILVLELNRVLEPSHEFTRLVIANLESRKLTEAVVESWKPIVANAIQDWARQRTLTAVLSAPAPVEVAETTKVVTTEEELQAFATIGKLLGADRAIGYADSTNYFKVHLAQKHTWVFARLFLDRKNRAVSVPLPLEKVTPLVGGRTVDFSGGWSTVSIGTAAEIGELGELFGAAFAAVRDGKSKADV